MIGNGIYAFKDKRVLLLQGPLGPFFRRLAKDLEACGAEVFKVNFNGGDLFFYPVGAINFRGSLEEWPAFFEKMLADLKVDIVFLFGDCRPIHSAAHEIAKRLGVDIGVFEEGYIRPDHVTLERFGVNAFSQISRNPDFYLDAESVKHHPTEKVGNTFWYSALWALLYYLSGCILWPFFYRYRHHRPLSPLEVWPWVLSIFRKGYYAVKEYGTLTRLIGPLSKHFFLVPLQVHYDSQIHTHSSFDSVLKFIGEVVDSFAHNAPPDTVLVLKHHPMDRGYIDYSRVIHTHVQKYNLHGRCLYIHDQHLPDLLKKALGVVVINSTVGLSAIYHGTPVKVCGNAIYNIKGLTFQGTLEQFWNESLRGCPNPKLYVNFKNYLIRHTQLNGSFYKRLPKKKLRTGVNWSEYKEVSVAGDRNKASLIYDSK